MVRRAVVAVVVLVAALVTATPASAGTGAATVAPASTVTASTVTATTSARCTGKLTFLGLREDGRLSRAVVDPATGRRTGATHAATALGIDARAWTALDTRTLLVTERGTGALWRVDVTGTAPLTATRTRLASSGWAVPFLAFDGASHLYGLDSGRLVRWTVATGAPVTAASLTARTNLGWIGTLRAFTASGADHLYVTTSTGRLVELTFDAAGRMGRTDVVTSGWTAQRHVLSPGGGLVFAVARGSHTMTWYARTAAGFAAQPLAAVSWGQARLAVVQAPCVTSLPVETDCTKVTTSMPQQYTVVTSGYRVHPCVSSRVTGLVAAAKSAGFALGGSAWRDTAAQIELRKKNCGTSQYDIWEKPAEECTPPTAQPGTSQHERGLALDLTANGASVTSSSAAFAWLKANAATYGFKNLPSEPWHWSTTGW